MNIFLSWSGERSRLVSEALRDWLPRVINAVTPWASTSDIDKGVRWSSEISEKLKNSNFGILCLTPDNLHSDWMLFEAGALSRSLKNSRVCPLLIDLEPSDVSLPLAQFQATRASKSEIRKLLETINSSLEKESLSGNHLNDAFEVWWPRLEQALLVLPSSSTRVATRIDRDLLEEILALTRSQTLRASPISKPDYDQNILPIRRALRDISLELKIGYPSYDFTWDSSRIYLHLDGYEVSTRVALNLPVSEEQARERVRAGLLRFERISDLRYWDDEEDGKPTS